MEARDAAVSGQGRKPRPARCVARQGAPTRAAVGALAALMLVLADCGSSSHGGPSAATATVTATRDTAFCGAVTTFTTSIVSPTNAHSSLSSSVVPAIERTQRALATMRADAPGAIRSDVDRVATVWSPVFSALLAGARQPGSTPPASFPAQAQKATSVLFGPAGEAIGAWARAHCPGYPSRTASANGRAMSSPTASAPSASPTSSGPPSGRPSSWPAVVAEVMVDVAPRTSVPLEAPRVLPAAGGLPNSALVRAASPTDYGVSLHDCPAPLPLNDPGIGAGSCGSMAALYGDFAGHAYSSATAALSALSQRLTGELHPPAGCTSISHVQLAPGLEATLYSGPAPRGNCLVVWQEGEWTFTLAGDLNGGLGGDASEPWTAVAHDIVSYLDRHLLAETHGSFSCEMGGDGLHSGLAWVRGDDVYMASAYHGAIPALALAIAMARYPG